MILKAVIFDIDGTIMPQGGPIDPRVGVVFRGLQKAGIKIGPATGKNADYGRGLACGVGVVWDFVIAETGAQVLETIAWTPPAFRQHTVVPGGNKDLAIFARKIGLDAIGRTFDLRGHLQEYRPELKECILTLFPSGKNAEETQEWLPYFEGMIALCNLELKVQRHGDGCIDILPSAVNKSLGAYAVCRMIGCSVEEVLTAVDGVNDFELILPGCQAIAVANAVESIKAATTGHGGFVSAYGCGMGFVDGLLHYARQEAFGTSGAGITEVIRNEFPELS